MPRKRGSTLYSIIYLWITSRTLLLQHGSLINLWPSPAKPPGLSGWGRSADRCSLPGHLWPPRLLPLGQGDRGEAGGQLSPPDHCCLHGGQSCPTKTATGIITLLVFIFKCQGLVSRKHLSTNSTFLSIGLRWNEIISALHQCFQEIHCLKFFLFNNQFFINHHLNNITKFSSAPNWTPQTQSNKIKFFLRC